MARPTAPTGLHKPTMDTRFHISYDWWEESGKDIELHIQEMCEEYGGIEFEEDSREHEVDWIDPRTAIVRRVDGVTYKFLSLCSVHEDFITERMTLIEACFRALLASANRPMTPQEMADMTGRSADMILKTLSGQRVYKGIRPSEAAKP